MLRRAISFSNTGLPEADRTLEALASTARVFEQHDKERDEREAHVRLIMRELSHRSKNLLAIVLAIARQTSRHTTSFSDFESRFNSRIQALADAHDLLVEQQWSGARIDDLVRAQLAAFGMEKVTCRGEPILLKAEAVQNVALALHDTRHQCLEIRRAVGARRQGRHRMDTGGGSARERDLRLTWRESGGPPVTAPSQKGFGCFVLERVTVNALGEGKLEFNPDGLVWTCIIRPEHLVDEVADDAAPKQQVAAANPPVRRVS